MDEVVIVGAGPAGSIAALLLARSGVRVRLVDRARFPRRKLCGDTLNPGSLALLDRLGLGAAIRAAATPIRGMIVTGPDGASIAAQYPDGLYGAAITRRDLDMHLVEAAVSAGATFVPEVRALEPVFDSRRVAGIRVRSAQGTSVLRARLVIAADGRASRLAAALGISRLARTPRRWAFGAYVEGVDGMTDRGEMHVRLHGYIGIAPVGRGIANVCVVREERVGAPSRVSPESAIAAVRQDPLLRERLGAARWVTPVLGLGPLAVDAYGAGYPGLLVAGDAAGFVDPMTGDGMRFAIRGGELAAAAALRELASGAPAYDDLWRARRREFAGKWQFNRMLRALVGSRLGLRAASALTVRWGAPVRHIVAIAGDVTLARSVASSRPADAFR